MKSLSKLELRALSRQRLAAKNLNELFDQSHECCHYLVKFLRTLPHPVRILGLYAPLADEIQWNQNHAFMSWIDQEINSGMKICFPHFSANENSGMKFYETASSDPEKLQKVEVFQKKMLVPVQEQKLECIPDCFIVPGLGFDQQGFRLGRGKGYYDRYLLGKPGLKIGLTFDDLFLDKIPANECDVPMDLVISNQGIRFKQSESAILR